jgi:uncharacterized BrkB/YihY/UPF0761 family membrane protein
MEGLTHAAYRLLYFRLPRRRRRRVRLFPAAGAAAAAAAAAAILLLEQLFCQFCTPIAN